MEITLARTVELEAYDAVMEIGKGERRKDILAVLMRAQELGGRITPEEICKSFFPERPAALGRNVISRCAEFGVLHRDGQITELGKEALAKGRVFQPERGRYRAFCTQDSLLPQRLLVVEPVAEPRVNHEMNERREAKPKEKGGAKTTFARKDIEVPTWLKALENHTVNLVDSGEEIAILKVETFCLPVQVEKNKALRLRWMLPAEDDPTLRVEGLANRVLEPPEVPHEQVLTELLRNEGHEWDVDGGVLRCSFAELTDAERSSFRRNLGVESPTLRAYGKFEPTEIRDLPLAPHGPQDAQQWAEWILDQSITGYFGSQDYEDLLRRVRNLFPEFPPVLPTRENKAGELLREVDLRHDRLPRAFWFLQAPRDLEMPEVTP